MNRKEAITLLGRTVVAWTSANGVYVGVLEAISGSPWRGTVQITGVVEPAQAFEVGRAHGRRGLRPGEQITVGGSSIKPAGDVVGLSYLEALEQDVERIQYLLMRAGSRDTWHLERALAVRREQIAAETLRTRQRT